MDETQAWEQTRQLRDQTQIVDLHQAPPVDLRPEWFTQLRELIEEGGFVITEYSADEQERERFIHQLREGLAAEERARRRQRVRDWIRGDQ